MSAVSFPLQPTSLVVSHTLKSLADEDIAALRERELAMVDAVAKFRVNHPNAILTENVTWTNHGIEGHFLLASPGLAVLFRLSI